MDLKDATLMMLNESSAYPDVSSLAQTAYDQIVNGEQVDWRVLDELIGEASGKGVLRALNAKYGSATAEAIYGPILAELGRAKPIRSQRYV